MKKLFKISIASLAVSLLLTACGGASSSSPSPSASSSADPSASASMTASADPSASAASPSTSDLTGSVTASGSSALLPFAQFLADSFKVANPQVQITVNGGGSGKGLADVYAKSVDIGMSDVYANEKLDPDKAATLVDNKVCTIGVGVVVNADIGIKDISKDNLKKIFAGEITNWKDVGGKDEKIVIVNRPASSGTRALFTKWALDGQKIPDTGDTTVQTDDSAALSEQITTTSGAIGYLAFSYLTDPASKFVTLSIDGVAPTNDNIYNNTYNVWGYEHMYTNGTPTGAVKAFIDYAEDPSVVPQYEAMGYGSISKLNADAAASR